MIFKKGIAGILCAALSALSLGPQACLAIAAEVSAPSSARVPLSGVSALPPDLGAGVVPINSLPPSVLELPNMAAAPVSALPSPLSPAAAVSPSRALETQARRLAGAARPAERQGVLDQSFEGRGSAAESSAPAAPESPPAIGEAASGLAPVSIGGRPIAAAPPGPARAQRRSAFFPMALAMTASAATGLFFGARGLLAHGAAPGWAHAPVLFGLHGLAGVLGGLTGLAAAALVAATLLDAVVFTVAMARGRNVTDEQFKSFVREKLEPGVADLIEIYRPSHRYRGLTFGLATSESIYLRPELAAWPLLFRIVLIHEMHHFNLNRERGPPRESSLRGAWNYILAELGARASEIKGPQALKDVKISTLERSLHQAQYSLRLDQPYDVLVVNPSSPELVNPAVYRRLSAGLAKVETITARDPRPVLGAAPGRYRAVVIDQPFEALPPVGTPDAKRLDAALAQLQTLHWLATRRAGEADEAALPSAAEPSPFRDLARKAKDLDRGNKKAVDAFERQIRDYWREIAATKFKDLAVNGWIAGLYASLQDKGFAFLSFGSADPGVTSWEKLLRYWQAEDGGRFQMTRVDLEDGGHILLLRKTEARVGLWIKPLKGGLIRASIPDADGSPERRAAARAALEEAGFQGQLARFDELGVKVSQVFGADVQRQEIFITVPRRKAGAIRKFVTGSEIQVEPSEANFETHLMDAGPLQRLPAVRARGFNGKGQAAMVIDTGSDAANPDFGGRLEPIDMTGEGNEAWIIHGVHVGGIVGSQDSVYTGMAPEASIVSAKVFPRDGIGASDGPIMGAATIAFQRGTPALKASATMPSINESFGSPGNSGSNLSLFMSNLTEAKNERGESVLIVVSAGNSGPFDGTVSQPAAGSGRGLVAVAAANKDKRIDFYSSAGPDLDPRFGIPRLRLKPDITAIGGHIPGLKTFYQQGVASTKSRFGPRRDDDTADGKHTLMSGTSMAAPMVTGIAVHVLKALSLLDSDRRVLAFAWEHLPFAVKAILMRSADDLGVPIWSQGAGLVNAEAAVALVLPWAENRLRLGLARLPGLGWTAPAAQARDWEWLERYHAIFDLEDQVYKTAELAKTETMARFEESAEDGETPAEGRRAMGDAAYVEMEKSFRAAREAALPQLLKAVDYKQEPVWLIRMQAALSLLNFKSPASALPLAQAALNDPDGRVRRMAFLALAQIPGRATDVLLQKASSDARPSVGVYAAYALARHGDRSAVPRIVAETSAQDYGERQTAIWLLGQLGRVVLASEAETLSKIVADPAQDGNLRHFAVAALTNIAGEKAEAVTDKVVADLLGAAGSQDLETLTLTRTISKLFPVALRSKALVERMKTEPLRSVVARFVVANRGAAAVPGALGELVLSLARLLGIALDAPTPAPDKSGLGVLGVDGDMGPIDLIVEPPAGGPGLEEGFLSRYESSLGEALPVSGALWLSVPEHKLYALSVELRRRGFKAWLSRPFYPLGGGDPSAAPGVLEIDPAAAAPELPSSGSLPILKIRPAAGVSEARVMAALERLRGAAADPLARPVLALLDFTSPAEKNAARRPLARLIRRLMLDNIGIIAPAGDAGPADDTVALPAAAGLAVVVAAASPATGLQFYSSRSSPERALVSWADSVDELDAAAPPAATAAVGTSAAAQRSALMLARLAARMPREAGGRLPDGYFFALENIVRQTADPVANAQAHEVGAGRGDEAKAALLLDRRSKDAAALEREAAALIQDARARQNPAPAAPAAAVAVKAPWWRKILTAPLIGLTVSPVAAQRWWAGPAARTAVTVPLYALRREKNDPGIGKFADLGSYYREVLAKQGVDTVLLLPHFATLGESPYAPVSLYALNEDYVDWSRVEELSARPALLALLSAPATSVDYGALRARESHMAQLAYQYFEREHLARQTARAREFQAFIGDNAGWLTDYAEFMAFSRILGKPAVDWTPQELEQARQDSRFERWANVHRYAQWNALRQFKQAVDAVHEAGGHLLFDVPMFRGKNSVDAWKYPQYFTDLRTRNPGIENQWVHEDWRDLALWNWSRLKSEDYRFILDPYSYWLSLGLDGARVDALHFAYRFGNGQKASGDEPGDDYARALGGVLQARGAFPLAEAYEGKAEDISRLGFVTVGGDWVKISSHDDPRRPGLLPRLLEALRRPGSGRGARFAAYTLGDEWSDPLPVKEMRGGSSLWRYRIPIPADADYADRTRWDARPQLRALKAKAEGDVWKDAEALAAVLRLAAGTFVKHFDGSVQIWAASMDWFLEEWGRDTFVSLPGLLLSTGRFDEAKENMRAFARYERGGIIPNKVAGGLGSDYNTVDGSLWFIQAVKKYVETTQDWDFAAEMMPVLRRVAAGYSQGTGYFRYGRYNKIYMDSDGLIVSPAQATWMDADPEGRDRPVTPRDGKAVEINALWYSSLRFLARAESRLGQGEAAAADDRLADKVKASFNEKFWFTTDDNRRAWGETGGALRDVVEGDPHGEAIRPNMLFAVSHGEDLLSPERRRAVVLAATRDLLTPYGLRTLSPRDSFYRARYDTAQPPLEKDQAYHQGTAWPWLIGAYVDALALARRAQGWDEARIREEAAAVMTPLMEFMVGRPEGSLPEVFDGGAPIEALRSFSLDDPQGLRGALAGVRSGQNAGGTRSQAWSVAEAARVLVEHGLLRLKD